MKLYNKYQELKEYYLFIEDRLFNFDWENDGEIAGIMAETNCEFYMDEVIDINLEDISNNKISFSASIHFFGESNDNDRPYMLSDIIAEYKGALIVDDYLELDKSYELDAQKIAPYEEEEMGNELVEKIFNRVLNQPKGLWFRGQTNIHKKLRPSISRVSGISQYKELKLKNEYSKRIAHLEQIKDEEEFYFLMQHYGIKTRLLDWSSNPLVALYFAVNKDDENDGCIKIINPKILNHIFNEGDLITLSDLLSEKQDQSKVLAIKTRYTNKRMSAQGAEFTYHLNYDYMEDIKALNDLFYDTIEIPKEVKNKIKSKLSTLGVNQGTLFPDLENIAKAVIEDVLSDDWE